jgi:hypothetical protein
VVDSSESSESEAAEEEAVEGGGELREEELEALMERRRAIVEGRYGRRDFYNQYHKGGGGEGESDSHSRARQDGQAVAGSNERGGSFFNGRPGLEEVHGAERKNVGGLEHIIGRGGTGGFQKARIYIGTGDACARGGTVGAK